MVCEGSGREEVHLENYGMVSNNCFQFDLLRIGLLRIVVAKESVAGKVSKCENELMESS